MKIHVYTYTFNPLAKLKSIPQMQVPHRRRTTRIAATDAVALPRRHESDGGEEDEQGPVWTFRVMLLGSISFLILLILNKYILNQTGQWILGMASALVVLYPMGYIMEIIIPRRRIYYPVFGFEFSVNPGPFGLREYALISIFANMGAIIGAFTSYSIDWSYV
ncbi:hypothetical protein CDL12_24324 [Handroanthus impetiginosus]|uniref:Oligopeptide transporter n=1 Tax=Handroanthus impetiginosus TaxID=429701 RepID=A0A2G9GCY9_9LAMI|nr:hypothetical protein CDL12_24324 [Handroanthus impetiginosus]